MSIISRFKDIMSANINALLDKCEDPAKMVDEYLRQVSEELAEVKKETASIMAEEKRAKRLVDENKEQIEKYDNLARKALTAGNEDDARVFLAKKQQYVTNGEDLQKSYDIAHDNAEKMREMHDKLTKDLQTLEQSRRNVKAKVAVAKTQEKMNKITGSMDSASSSMKAFERMEEKADHMLDQVNSMAELDSVLVDEATSLEEKYSDKDKEMEVPLYLHAQMLYCVSYSNKFGHLFIVEYPDACCFEYFTAKQSVRDHVKKFFGNVRWKRIDKSLLPQKPLYKRREILDVEGHCKYW